MHVIATFLMGFVPVRLAHRLVGFLAPLVVSLVARDYVSRASDNMRQVLGPSADPREARRLTRAAFANYARYMVDLVRLPHIRPDELIDNIRVEGWEHVEAAYNYGKG